MSSGQDSNQDEFFTIRVFPALTSHNLKDRFQERCRIRMFASQMDRRERRRRTRERKKLEEKLRKEALHPEPQPQVPESRLLRFSGAMKRALKPKVIWSVIAPLLALLGGWAQVRPHISVEPNISLNPVNPYSVQFTVKNENRLFEARDINCVCWPRKMESGNGFSVLSLGPLPHLNHQMKILTPGASSTVDCPPVIGGLGTYSGQVLYAELEIEVFYSQSWWPFAQSERFPFLSKRDVQGAVRWIHITPEEEKPFLPPKS